ncbi:hypothetical protein BAE44_0019280, partial [Dichanthelium oligosanthes]
LPCSLLQNMMPHCNNTFSKKKNYNNSETSQSSMVAVI